MFGLYIQGNSRGILSFLFDVLPIEFVFGRLYEPWYGIFTQRNTLGIMMAFAIFVFYLRSRSDPEEKWSAYLWASLSSLLLFLSGSLTGFLGLWAVMVGGVLLGNIRRHRRWARRILLATAVMAGVGVYYAAGHPASVTSFFFADPGNNGCSRQVSPVLIACGGIEPPVDASLSSSTRLTLALPA